MKSRLKYISLVLLFLSHSLWCQEIKTVRDLGLWAGVGINKKFNKKWSTSGDVEVRTFDNLTKISRVLSDIGLEYKINKKFQLGTAVRYGLDRKKDLTYVHEIRYHFDLKYKHNISDKLDFIYRLRFQNKYSNVFIRKPKPIFEHTANLRNRVKLQYQLPDNSQLYVSSELFREFVFFRRPYFNKMRFLIGNNRKINSNKLNYAFAYEFELNEEFPLNFFFMKVNYTFKLKKREHKND